MLILSQPQTIHSTCPLHRPASDVQSTQSSPIRATGAKDVQVNSVMYACARLFARDQCRMM
ncbi:MAG: hypothetical protein OJF49_000999 [Ktedonobacterales bacterium]|nr:MAG: hypothetical protein OJF49_000999 [Ktedonobacterales bacterium]